MWLGFGHDDVVLQTLLQMQPQDANNFDEGAQWELYGSEKNCDLVVQVRQSRLRLPISDYCVVPLASGACIYHACARIYTCARARRLVQSQRSGLINSLCLCGLVCLCAVVAAWPVSRAMEAEADTEGSLTMKKSGGRDSCLSRSLSYLAKCEPGMLKVCQRLASPMRRAERKSGCRWNWHL